MYPEIHIHNSKLKFKNYATYLYKNNDELSFLLSVAKKKSNKKRLKELDAKQDSTDILSAFTDTPKKEEPVVEPPAPQPPKEDPTWEDKVLSALFCFK